jgi:hypothetical protein
MGRAFRGGAGGRGLIVLCALDAAAQVLARVYPHPFQGFGVVAFALLPVIFAYYAFLLFAIAAGIPLAIACFWRGGRARIVIGVALLALTGANIAAVIDFMTHERAASRAADTRNAEFYAEVAKCAAVMKQRAEEAATYFSEPRKVVALAGPYGVEFENGMRISLPPIHPPQPFQEFFYDYLKGAQVRVALRPRSAGEMGAGCPLASSAGYPQTYEGDVYLLDRKIDAAAYVDREFPRPARPNDLANAPARKISRWFDAYTGDRTYGTTGTKPAAGYVVEGKPFSVRASAGADTLGLYLCNFPLKRPDSPEHFLSTDENCEGQEKVALLGHISATRDGLTPRALLRCIMTVQSKLRTGPRHLATSDVLECRNRSIELVLGFVES